MNISNVMRSRCYANETFETSQPEHQGLAEIQIRSIIWEAMQAPPEPKKTQLHAQNLIFFTHAEQKFLLSAIL